MPGLAVAHAGLPVVHDVGSIAVVLKDAGQRLGEAGVVFHDQNVHGDPFRKWAVATDASGSIVALRSVCPELLWRWTR